MFLFSQDHEYTVYNNNARLFSHVLLLIRSLPFSICLFPFVIGGLRAIKNGGEDDAVETVAASAVQEVRGKVVGAEVGGL